MKNDNLKFKIFSFLGLSLIFLAFSFIFLNFASAQSYEVEQGGTIKGLPFTPSSVSESNIQAPSGGSESNIKAPSGGSESNIQAPVSGNRNYGGTIKIPNPLKVNDISGLIDRIVNWLIIIGAPILTLMVLIGAFQILTAVGDTEKAIEGRKTITYAVAGYILLLISKGITMIIAELFGTG